MKIFNQTRNQDGTYGTKMGWNDIAAGVFTLLIVIGTLVSVIRSNMKPVNAEAPVTIEVIQEARNGGCIQTGEKSWDCSDPEAFRKWKAWESITAEKNLPKNVLRQVCIERGYTDDDCPSILYGMAMTESRMKPNAVGDSGKSHGWFQIHLGYHPDIKKSCATDLRCAANWTLKRMIAYGFGENTNFSIMKHNGTPNTPATKKYLASVLTFAKGF